MEKPTAYARAHGVYVLTAQDAQSWYVDGYDMSYMVGVGWWWLRSPGYLGDIAAFVLSSGGVDCNGHTVDGNLIGVRPALKVAY